MRNLRSAINTGLIAEQRCAAAYIGFEEPAPDSRREAWRKLNVEIGGNNLAAQTAH